MIKRQWAIERDNLPKPTRKGERIAGLHCACGWCTETHAYVVADYVKFDDKEYLVWLDKSPCVDKIERQILRKL